MNTIIIEPNTQTNFVEHDGPKLILKVIEGSCEIETNYNNDHLVVTKEPDQIYVIEKKVEYRIKNTCNLPCKLCIIRELEKKDDEQLCENSTIWDLNHIKQDIHSNYKIGTKKFLSAAA